MEARDEVDVIVGEWRRERSDLDLSPLEVFSRIDRLAKRLDLARREAFERSGIESWEFDVLSALRRAGEPHQLHPGALMKLTLVSSGAMTNRINRLSERGWVTRVPDPDDRRAVLVTATKDGLARVDRALAILLHAERALLASLDESERTELAELLRKLSIGFESR